MERIARLGVGQVVSCPSDDSSMMSMEGEELQFSDAPSMSPPMDMDREAGEESEEPVGSKEGADGWMSPKEGAEVNPCTDRHQHSGNWESVMEELEGLAYDDPCSNSNATITGVDSLPVPPLSSCDESGNSPPTTLRGTAPHLPGSPMEQMPPLVPAVATPAYRMDTVEVHIPQSKLDNL